MAALTSPNHCCSSSSSYSGSASSVELHRHHGINSFSPISRKLLRSKGVSMQSNSGPLSNAIRMQDGALATKTTAVGEALPTKLKEGLLSVTHPVEQGNPVGSDADSDESTVSITVVGASGDLAKKKIFPALFALYYEDCLPKHFTIFGYARSKMTDAELREMVSRTLTCRIDKRENCGEKMEQFLKRCFYHAGQYDSQENFEELNKKLKEHEVDTL